MNAKQRGILNALQALSDCDAYIANTQAEIVSLQGRLALAQTDHAKAVAARQGYADAVQAAMKA
jgi:hypothetical protein